MKSKSPKYSLLLFSPNLSKENYEIISNRIQPVSGIEVCTNIIPKRDYLKTFKYVLICDDLNLLSKSDIQSIYQKRFQIVGNHKGLRIVDMPKTFLLKSSEFKKLNEKIDVGIDDKMNISAYLKTLDFFLFPQKIGSKGLNKNYLVSFQEIFKDIYKTSKYYLGSLSYNNFNKGKESFWGGCFVVFAIISLVILLLNGNSAGISGDEFRYDQQSEKVYDYFKTFGNDKRAISSTGIDPQHYNAQSFDVIVFTLQKWCGIEDTFKLRHFFNSIVGWCGIFVAALLAARLFGWKAGVLTFFLIFISPRYFGHSLNNHRDIPVATAYIFSIYYLIKYLLHFPKPSKQTLFFLLLSIAAAFSIRFASGILTIGIIGVCCIAQLVLQYFEKKKFNLVFQSIRKHATYLSIVFLGSIVLGNLLWPFFWESPLKNSLEVFRASSNLGVSLRQIFEGEHIWSNTIPWYYISKYMLITTPVIVLIGFIIHFIFSFRIWKKGLRLPIFVLVFATLFPLIYAVFNVKNDYGGWRHFLFIYPSFAILSSLGLLVLKGFLPKKVKSYFPLFIILCSVLPIRHLIINSPYQYIYYNQFVGGVNGSSGFYETDYSFNSMQSGLNWVKRNAEQKQVGKIKVVANDPSQLSWAFRKDTANFQIQYTRYYDKYEKDWDYGVFTNSYISAHQLREDIWPPRGTIHSVKVDDVVVTAVVKRSDKRDLQGKNLIGQGDYQQGIQLMEAFVADNPNNEEALMALSNAYYNIGNYPKTIEIADRAIQVYPEAIGSFVTKGLSLLNSNQLDQAESTFRQGIEANANYYPTYYYLGMVLRRKNQPNEALRYAKMALRYNPKYRPAVELIISIYDSQNIKTEADRYRTYLNGL